METKKEKHKSVDRLSLSRARALLVFITNFLYNRTLSEIDHEEEVLMSLSPQWPTSALAGGAMIVTAI